MSVACGMTLPDGAIVVADSRVVSHHAGEPPGCAFEAKKIEEVCPGVVGVRFGVDESAVAVVDCLRVEAATLQRASDVRDLLEKLVEGEWATLQKTTKGFDPDILGLGVLTAGILARTSFLAATVRHSKGPLGAYFEDAGGLWIIGGGNREVHDRFYEEAGDAVRRCPWEPYRGPVNALVEAWLGIAWKAAVAIAQASPETSGGTIRAAVVRTGFGTKRYAFGAPRPELPWERD